MLNWQPDTLVEDRWSILNSSRVTHNDPALARYHTLLTALDAGWRVEPPVYVRADWSLKSRTKVFHFVLRRDSPAHDHPAQRAGLRSRARPDQRKRVVGEHERVIR